MYDLDTVDVLGQVRVVSFSMDIPLRGRDYSLLSPLEDVPRPRPLSLWVDAPGR
jgi:hypothetical protein